MPRARGGLEVDAIHARPHARDAFQLWGVLEHRRGDLLGAGDHAVDVGEEPPASASVSCALVGVERHLVARGLEQVEPAARHFGERRRG